MMASLPLKAVIDVGSNSVLLVAARREGEGWAPFFERTWVTGLGRGTKATGLLSPDGMEETLAALREAFALARDHGVERIVSAATMAARIARNTGDFLEACDRQDTPTFVLSGEDEADLGFLAVAQDPLFASADRLSIVDPGGHSTELVTAQREGAGWRTLFRRSFPVGALGLRDALWPDESPGFRERLAAVSAVDDAIGIRYLPRQCGLVVTLGATGTNLVSIRDALTEWEPDKVHGAVLDFEEVSKAVGWMCDMTDSERAAIPGLEKGREKTIHAGALILERFLHATAALETSVSVRGWRHALLSREDVAPLP